jgi:tRNA pseudouridine32 synthase/23S rRNA pseudouridine746 synthase
MSASPLPLVYGDDDLLVLDKPAGLLCVPGRGEDKQDCLSAQVQAVYPDALVVHRLDMATSGLVVMARSPEAQRVLGDAFAARQVHKRYEALVQGNLSPPEQEWGLIDLPLIVDWPNRPRSKVDWEIGKPSTTRWQVLDTSPDATRVALEPITGRSHQLRVHLLALGHPILGDALYQGEEAASFARLMLHACRLTLPHPVHGKLVEFHSPTPF